MRYLQIADRLLNEISGLDDLIWPEFHTIHTGNETPFVETYYANQYIMRGQVHMVPEDHPNITMILLKISDHHWYDEDVGPYKFMKFI